MCECSFCAAHLSSLLAQALLSLLSIYVMFCASTALAKPMLSAAAITALIVGGSCFGVLTIACDLLDDGWHGSESRCSRQDQLTFAELFQHLVAVSSSADGAACKHTKCLLQLLQRPLPCTHSC
jgi:hypothetical protein